MSWRMRLAKYLVKSIDVDGTFLGSSLGSPAWSTENFDSLSREGYENVSTVFRCINLISKTAAMIALGVFQESDDGDELIPNHPFITKLRRPNPLQGRSAFLKYWITSLLVGGRAFIWAVPSSTGEILELWVLSPSNVQVNLGERFGMIHSFDWNYNGNTISLPPEHVLYTWFPNPRDQMLPISPLKAAAQEVDITNEGLRWNISLLANAARPNFYIHMSEKSEAGITDPQYEQLKHQLKTEYSGSKNIGKTPILRIPGLQLTPFGWSPQDMHWLEGLDKADVRIANVFDVPPELVGAQKTYENFAVADRVLITQAVLPILELFVDELNNWLMLGLDEKEFLGVLKDKIKQLQDDQDSISKRITTEVQNGIVTRNEARVALKYPKSDDPMADILTSDKEVSPLSESILNLGTVNAGDEDGR